MILICDDEKNIRRTLAMVLEGEGFEVQVAANGSEALVLVGQRSFDAVLLDVLMPGLNGLEVLRHIKESTVSSRAEVIMISGHATLHDAVEATRLGAFDFLEKPIDRERLLITVRNALERRDLRRRVAQLTERDEAILGDSDAIRHLLEQIGKVANTKARVLIGGESGSGKELVARAIHRLSARAQKPFIKVNCAAIPSELIESELFGHERGAFTGAVRARRGQFELAHQGTLLLDEIGDMSVSAQAKVLRVLQSGELMRVGSETPIQVDCRVLAATNKDLRAEIAAGNFREDLYFRLNVVPIQTPPLREHPEDIPLMTEAFLDVFAEEHDLPRKQVSPEALDLLRRYAWPGNVRELRNVIERLQIMGNNPIEVGDLPDYVRPTAPSLDQMLGARPGTHTLKRFRLLAERTYIEASLRANDWNVSRTAEVLGVERTNLHKKIKQYGIARDDG